jgi:hypothetical protein
MAEERDVATFEVLNTERIVRQEREALGLTEANQKPVALCLSGGGIRSAAFCLGALQVLARRELLHQFHYLSTVSGGGYIGGWLTRCIAEQNTVLEESGDSHPRTRPAKPGNGNLEITEHKILQDNWAPELSALRRYTNFLLPHPGLASSDTWAAIVLWVRNTLINWALFLPLLLLVASIPVIYLSLIGLLIALPGFWTVVGSIITGAAGLCFLTLAIFRGCINLPSHMHPDRCRIRTQPDEFGPTGKDIFRKIVVWVLAWALLAPISLAAVERPGGEAFSGLTVAVAATPFHASWWVIAALPVLNWFASLCAYLLAWHRVAAGYTYEVRENKTAHNAAFRDNFLSWAGSSALSASFLWIGAWLAVGHDVLWTALVGPVWTIFADILRSAVYVAVRKEGIRSDLDREWLARLNADKLRFIFAFALVQTSAIFLPIILRDYFPIAWAWITTTGVLGGPIAAMIGKSAKTGGSPRGKEAGRTTWFRTEWILKAAVALFAFALFMFAGSAAALIACAPARFLPSPPAQFGAAIIIALAVSLICWSAANSLGRRVDVNRFSMHATYRNRLVRGFFGSARPDNLRRPDRYTGFDPNDDVRLSHTFQNRSPKALFPVINVALNRTSGADTARAERQAEPFTITPLHCGSALLREGSGAYVPTEFYAGADKETGPRDREHGITLGTAVTISGAAVSPNMGYHSSPLIAFVMTLFNVRLGAWLPNPGMQTPNQQIMRRSGPLNALPMMLQELTGRSDNRGEFIYLSDGGHFDNLGLHEMLRRRCERIVIIDAGRDEDYAYADLGRTLQHALIDLHVEIKFVQPVKVGVAKLPQHGAYAEIAYNDNGAVSKGQLLYIKPWLPDEAPTELKAFKALKQTFPHENTADQFFTESDFESYRRLGEYLTESILTACSSARAGTAVGELGDLEAVFAGAARIASTSQGCSASGESENADDHGWQLTRLNEEDQTLARKAPGEKTEISETKAIQRVSAE